MSCYYESCRRLYFQHGHVLTYPWRCKWRWIDLERVLELVRSDNVEKDIAVANMELVVILGQRVGYEVAWENILVFRVYEFLEYDLAVALIGILYHFKY